MKVFSAEKTRAWDAYTIDHEPIGSVELMNRAAGEFAEWFMEGYSQPIRPQVLIVCGTGNNGGDGVAVARLLTERLWEVNLLVCDFTGRRSSDFAQQVEQLPPALRASAEWLKDASKLPLVAEGAVVLDALFGSGLSREPQGDFARLIEWMNGLPNAVVSIDLPSGLLADRHTPGEAVVRADRTFSFETPKLALFFPENAGRVGEWAFGSIGLHPGFREETPTEFHFLTFGEAQRLVRRRSKFDHKGSFGHALLVAGSRGKMGAAVLAARACLRAGAGLLTLRAPQCGVDVVQIAVPEAMCDPDPAANEWSAPPDTQRYSAIGLGCGIGTAAQTEQALEELLRQSRCPLVLDADALNLLGKNPSWWAFLPKNSLLTPHPKEFERLFGKTANDFERNGLQRKMAQERGVFILLKGAYSAMACPDGSCWFNSTGNPGMATAGSGDVLTGLLTGLLAQGYAPRDAMLLGVFLHGLSGDLAAAEVSQQALVAGDLVERLGRAWGRVQHPKFFSPRTDFGNAHKSWLSLKD
jgi:ADP-dependent NAD(P)H-hydrate dehydratase / NAD(P)H-hydrate epimerase